MVDLLESLSSIPSRLKEYISELNNRISLYHKTVGAGLIAYDSIIRFLARPHAMEIIEKAGKHGHEAYVMLYNLGDVPFTYFLSMAGDMASEYTKKGFLKAVLRYVLPVAGTALLELTVGKPEINDFLIGLSGMVAYYLPEMWRLGKGNALKGWNYIKTISREKIEN